ncbi:MAG: hypothetical protein AB7K08_01010 [Microbacteriaceae bacterium]
MRFIWATRGQNWGFRFLSHGGFDDPLPAYDEIFGRFGDDPTEFRRVGGIVGLRFPDPLNRKDAAGRVIPHEFVVYGPEADVIDSVAAGKRLIWPTVRDQYARVWNLPDSR